MWVNHVFVCFCHVLPREYVNPINVNLEISRPPLTDGKNIWSVPSCWWLSLYPKKKISPKKSPVAIGHPKKKHQKKPPSGSPSVAAGHKRPAMRSPSMANSSATTQGPWHRGHRGCVEKNTSEEGKNHQCPGFGCHLGCESWILPNLGGFMEEFTRFTCLRKVIFVDSSGRLVFFKMLRKAHGNHIYILPCIDKQLLAGSDWYSWIDGAKPTCKIGLYGWRYAKKIHYYVIIHTMYVHNIRGS